MLEYLSALDEETTEVCSLGSPRCPALPLVEEEEAPFDPEPDRLTKACDDPEFSSDHLVCAESGPQEPLPKPASPHLNSSPCYYFYQGEWAEGRGQRGRPWEVAKG